MTARDRYTVTLTCPQCGVTGKANVSENDSRWSGPEFSVESVPDGFVYSHPSPFPQHAKFSCAKCRVVVNER